MRAKIDSRHRVREAFVPAGQRRVVVALVVHIPAEDNVAKAEATFGSGEEFVLVQILAAQHAVDVGHSDLDAIAG